jgi:hypothetical protein
MQSVSFGADEVDERAQAVVCWILPKIQHTNPDRR